MISLPEELLSQVDNAAISEKRTRSEFIREAMKLYILERRKQQIREKMQRGYQEMAGINLNLCRESFLVENESDKAIELLLRGEGS